MGLPPYGLGTCGRAMEIGQLEDHTEAALRRAIEAAARDPSARGALAQVLSVAERSLEWRRRRERSGSERGPAEIGQERPSPARGRGRQRRSPDVLRETRDRGAAIGQASHAWLWVHAGTSMGQTRFGALDRRGGGPSVRAHDVGMADGTWSDSQSEVTVRPHSFIEMPLATNWRWGAPEAAASKSETLSGLPSDARRRLYMVAIWTSSSRSGTAVHAGFRARSGVPGIAAQLVREDRNCRRGKSEQ